MNDPAQERALSTQELSDLRQKTEAVSELLRRRLVGHLETIRPILAPQRLLGKHVRSGQRADVRGADRAYEELKRGYAEVASHPFGLSRELAEDPISIEGKVELYPWEYTHVLEGGKEISLISPVRWVLAYSSGYTLTQLRRAILSREPRRTEDVRQFVVSAVALGLLVKGHPEISALLQDLRYTVQVATCDALGELPLVTLSSSVASFRPADDLIETATRFSGVPAFIELIDTDAVRTLRDPLRDRIEQVMR